MTHHGRDDGPPPRIDRRSPGELKSRAAAAGLRGIDEIRRDERPGPRIQATRRVRLDPDLSRKIIRMLPPPRETAPRGSLYGGDDGGDTGGGEPRPRTRAVPEPPQLPVPYRPRADAVGRAGRPVTPERRYAGRLLAEAARRWDAFRRAAGVGAGRGKTRRGPDFDTDHFSEEHFFRKERRVSIDRSRLGPVLALAAVILVLSPGVLGIGDRPAPVPDRVAAAAGEPRTVGRAEAAVALVAERPRDPLPTETPAPTPARTTPDWLHAGVAQNGSVGLYAVTPAAARAFGRRPEAGATISNPAIRQAILDRLGLPDPERLARTEAALALPAPRIEEVKARLTAAGRPPERDEEGIGLATRSALARWQAEAGLRPTGFLDARTLARLDDETANVGRRTSRTARAARAAPETAPIPASARPREVLPVAGCRRDGSGSMVPGQSLACDLRGLFEAAAAPPSDPDRVDRITALERDAGADR